MNAHLSWRATVARKACPANFEVFAGTLAPNAIRIRVDNACCSQNTLENNTTVVSSAQK